MEHTRTQFLVSVLTSWPWVFALVLRAVWGHQPLPALPAPSPLRIQEVTAVSVLCKLQGVKSALRVSFNDSNNN